MELSAKLRGPHCSSLSSGLNQRCRLDTADNLVTLELVVEVDRILRFSGAQVCGPDHDFPGAKLRGPDWAFAGAVFCDASYEACLTVAVTRPILGLGRLD